MAASGKWYKVHFWNRESGWKHSSVKVQSSSNKPAEIAKSAVELVKGEDGKGEDLSSLRPSVHDADTGEGIPEPEESK